MYIEFKSCKHKSVRKLVFQYNIRTWFDGSDLTLFFIIYIFPIYLLNIIPNFICLYVDPNERADVFFYYIFFFWPPQNQAGDGGWMGPKNRRMGGREERRAGEDFFEARGRAFAEGVFRKEQKRLPEREKEFFLQWTWS